jgi:hypothetical protein
MNASTDTWTAFVDGVFAAKAEQRYREMRRRYRY